MNRSMIACAIGMSACAGIASGQVVLGGSSSITATGQVFNYSFSGLDPSMGDATIRVFGLGDYSVVPPSSETMTWDIDGIASDVGFGEDAFEGPVDLFQNEVDQTWTIAAADMAAITADGMLNLTLTNATAVNFFSDQPEDFLAFQITYTAVPAPASAALLGLGGLAAARRRR